MIVYVDGDLKKSADDESDDACAIVNKQQQKHGHDGGEILNYELVVGNSDDSEYEEEDDPDNDEISDSDDDLHEAEARLETLKKRQKLLLKQTKRDRIAKEVEKSLKKLKVPLGRERRSLLPLHLEQWTMWWRRSIG